MTIYNLARVLCLVYSVVCGAHGFVSSPRIPRVYLPKSSPLTQQRSSLAPATSNSCRFLLPTTGSYDRAEGTASLSTALRMSSYDGGPSGEEMQMEMQELIVEFTDDGRVLLEVKGVKGAACRELTEDLIKALGEVITTENTNEYYEDKVVNVQHDAIKVGWSYDSTMPEW